MPDKDPAVRLLLFLCTGNYYRSRFAEELFNSLAARENLDWRAMSRGLRVDSVEASYNIGPLSPDVMRALRQLNAWTEAIPRGPVQCNQEDLATANLVIAMKEAEHREMLAARYPGWDLKCRYWNVHDLDAATPQIALAEIVRLVGGLVRELRADSNRSGDQIVLGI